MTEQTKTAKQLDNERIELLAQAENLMVRSKTETLSDEEQQRLDGLLEQAEAKQNEVQMQRRSERLDALKTEMEQPMREAPRVYAEYKKRSLDDSELIHLWFRSNQGEKLSGDVHARAEREFGVNLRSSKLEIPCQFAIGPEGKIKKRVMSTINTGNGAETVFDSFSTQVTEYLTYFSPLLGYLPSETTANGQASDYIRIDDTALEATDITDTGGDEETPTIPEVEVASGLTRVATKVITAGVFKLSRQLDRDSPVNWRNYIARAGSHAIARKLEKDVVTGSGDGDPAPMGLLQSATSGGTVASFSPSNVDTFLDLIPDQYRQRLILLGNAATRSDVRNNYVDDVGRSLFDVNAAEDHTVVRLRGIPFVTSSYMTNNKLLVFNPDFYMVRYVGTIVISYLAEKYWPHSAWSMDLQFGACWLGPSTARYVLTKSGGS